jgi:hypothetical protein
MYIVECDILLRREYLAAQQTRWWEVRRQFVAKLQGTGVGAEVFAGGTPLLMRHALQSEYLINYCLESGGGPAMSSYVQLSTEGLLPFSLPAYESNTLTGLNWPLIRTCSTEY